MNPLCKYKSNGVKYKVDISVHVCTSMVRKQWIHSESIKAMEMMTMQEWYLHHGCLFLFHENIWYGQKWAGRRYQSAGCKKKNTIENLANYWKPSQIIENNGKMGRKSFFFCFSINFGKIYCGLIPCHSGAIRTCSRHFCDGVCFAKSTHITVLIKYISHLPKNATYSIYF